MELGNIHLASDAEIEETLNYAISQGVNFFDLCGGRGVYCNHCAPCPKGINIGLVNEYYDLSKVGDGLAKSHYEKLSIHADACIQCGHCERRCPFYVKQMGRMKAIRQYFER